MEEGIVLRVEHMPGSKNKPADAPSRLQVKEFLKLTNARMGLLRGGGRLFQPGELQAHADQFVEASLCVRTRSIYQRLTRDYVAFASKDESAAFGTESVKSYLATYLIC